jgi:pantothenate kinase
MRPERVFGRIYNFATVENALAFLAYATEVTAPYARFVEITQSGNQVRVDFMIDSIGKKHYDSLSAQLLATASTFA